VHDPAGGARAARKRDTTAELAAEPPVHGSTHASRATRVPARSRETRSSEVFPMADQPAPADTQAIRPENARKKRWRRRLIECALAVVSSDHLITGARQSSCHLAANHHIIVDHEHADTGRCGFARRGGFDRHRCC